MAQPPSDSSDREMVLVLTAILSYRALRGRRDELGLALLPEEKARLAELERLFATAAPGEDDERPAFLLRLNRRVPLQLAVEVAGEAGVPGPGLLTNLSAGGFFVECPEPAAVGQVIRFRFVDREAARCWLFSGTVEWRRAGIDPGVGVRFVGVPVELHLGSQPGTGGPLSVAA